MIYLILFTVNAINFVINKVDLITLSHIGTSCKKKHVKQQCQSH